MDEKQKTEKGTQIEGQKEGKGYSKGRGTTVEPETPNLRCFNSLLEGTLGSC